MEMENHVEVNGVPEERVCDGAQIGLPEFVDDTVTDYSRPTPSIDASKCNKSELQSSNFSDFKYGESSDSIMSKPMIKFVKEADCPRVIKTNNTKNAWKSNGKYAEMYRNILTGKNWRKDNYAHKSMTPRAVLLKPGTTPIVVSRPNMNVAQLKMTSFAKTTHSNVKRPFQRKSAVKNQPRVPRVFTVAGKIPTFDSKFPNAKSTLTADLGNKGKAVKALACWIWRPKKNTSEQGSNCNGVSVTFNKYQYIDTQSRLKFTWTFFLRTKDETSSILRNFITETKNLNEFCTKKGIRREFSNARTPQQNEVAERRNKTLIEAAETMLADIKIHVTFWTEAVNTAFHLGKFDAKGNEGYFVGYSLSSKAFRVFNKRTKKVEENLHVDFLENKLIEKGAGAKDVASQAVKKDASSLKYIPLPNWISNPTATLKVPLADQVEPAVSLTVEYNILTVGSPVPTVCLNISPDSSSGPRLISKEDFSQKETPSLGNALTLSNKFEDTFGVEADLSNMEISIPVSLTPTFRIHKDHPKSQIIGPVDTPVQTKHQFKDMGEQIFIAIIHQKTNPELLQFYLFSCFLSQEEPKKIFDALKDPN
nr:hypothetical protein [Tanacetum cinerariifolium]